MRLFLLLLLLIPSFASAQEKPRPLPTPPAILSPALCGKGTFLILIAGASVGRETFDVRCVEGGGFAANGHTEIKLPAATIDLITTIDLDKTAVPSRFTTKGVMALTDVDQTVELKDGTAKVTSKEGSQSVAYQNGAAMMISNVTYLFSFVAARYDVARGGEQTITVFPNLAVKMEHTSRDEVRATGMAAAPKPSAFDRYTLKLGEITLLMWADSDGRVALMSLPAQQFVAVREEYTKFVEPLHASLGSVMKNLKPDYSAPADAPFTAEEVRIKVKDYQLAGTLLLPKTGQRPFPVVVTSTGSGQQTRDSPVPYPNLKDYKIFRQIAEHLASRGVAVLRVDDRGVGDSTGMQTLEKATTFDFADDVRAQVAYLRTRSEIDPKRVAIVGHSEGGIIAPIVAAGDPQIAAIVLLAGTGERGDKVLLYQMNRPFEINPALSEDEKAKKRAENQKTLQIVIDGGDVSKLPPIFRFEWTKVFLTYDPLTSIRKVRQPIFIVQGGLDQQVTAEQAEIIARAARDAGNLDVMVRVFPNLNHLFLVAKTGDESEYSTIQNSAVGEDVIKAIGDWLEFKLQKGVSGRRR